MCVCSLVNDPESVILIWETILFCFLLAGRTRRSVARAATRRNYTYGDDENAQTTLLKLKKVIDSDSDAD